MRPLLALLALLAGALAAHASGLGVGGPGGGGSGDTIAIATISTKAQGVGFDISGNLSGAAVATGVDFQINCSGGWTALSSPTITTTTWASTAADVVFASSGAGKTVCVREQPSTSVAAASNSFTVSADAITINTPAGQAVSVAFDSFGGTWNGTTPTNVDLAYSTTNACPGTGSWATLGGVFTAGSPWSSTGTISIGSGGNYYLCARKTNDTSSIGITSATFAVSSAVTLNPSDNSNVTLSNGNLTAANPTTHNNWQSVRSTTSHSTGKYYFEVTCDAAPASPGGWLVGFLNATGSLTTQVGGDTHGIGFQSFTGGDAWLNGSPVNTWQQCTANGQIIGFAIDFGAQLAWAKNVTLASGWNSALGGTQDPATGQGGSSFAYESGAMFVTSSIYYNGSNTTQMTFNFGATSYTGTAPSGFGNW